MALVVGEQVTSEVLIASGAIGVIDNFEESVLISNSSHDSSIPFYIYNVTCWLGLCKDYCVKKMSRVDFFYLLLSPLPQLFAWLLGEDVIDLKT